jgi:hypothetical protein
LAKTQPLSSPPAETPMPQNRAISLNPMIESNQLTGDCGENPLIALNQLTIAAHFSVPSVSSCG